MGSTSASANDGMLQAGLVNERQFHPGVGVDPWFGWAILLRIGHRGNRRDLVRGWFRFTLRRAYPAFELLRRLRCTLWAQHLAGQGPNDRVEERCFARAIAAFKERDSPSELVDIVIRRSRWHAKLMKARKSVRLQLL